MVLSEIPLLVAIGSAIGISAALASGRLVSGQLFGVQVADPLSIAAEGGYQSRGQTQWIEDSSLATALLGHFRTDVLPEVAKLWYLAAGAVVGHGYAGQLDDTAFAR